MRATICRGGGRGFTLVEMLVVVLIMGLLIGLVSVIVRPDTRGLLRIEAERLAQLMELAAAEANLTGKTIGWTANGPSYAFWRYREDSGWSEIRDNDLLRERTLPSGMTISALQVENMRPQGAMRLDFSAYAPPQFFTIELSFGEDRYAVVATAGGIVRALAGDGQSYAAPAL